MLWGLLVSRAGVCSPVITPSGSRATGGLTGTVWHLTGTNAHQDIGRWDRTAVYGVPGPTTSAVFRTLPIDEEFPGEQADGRRFAVTASVPTRLPFDLYELIPGDFDTNAESGNAHWRRQGLLGPPADSGPFAEAEAEGDEGGSRVGLVNLLFGACIFLIIMLRRRS